MEEAVVVPARLASKRFPKKLLFPIRGRPLILWTADRVAEVSGGRPVYFAVGDDELGEVLAREGFAVVPTPAELPSGTDRIAYANTRIGAKTIINVQADEPLVESGQIEALSSLLKEGADMATLATPFETEDDFKDPNKVKVVSDRNGRALYFSRCPIPYHRDEGFGYSSKPAWHMGLYAYTADCLKAFTEWEVGALERTEGLEQLRVLENGGEIRLGLVQARNIGIDTPAEVEEFLRRMPGGTET